MTLIFIVLLMDLLFPFIIAIPYKGYSHKKTVMSMLGTKKSPLGWLYNLWMVISGFVMIYFGYVLFSYYNFIEHPLALALLILFFLYGIGDEIISGLFTLNENKEDLTLSSIIHSIGSALGFTALQFAPLVLALLQFEAKEIFFGISSVIFFILSLISFAFFIIGEKLKFQNTFLSLEGLWQRLALLFMYCPFITWILYKL
ncbi:DUF998 domain-containing protein [Clostridium perfringens]|nr:DUF998 domain-containing protein [Clostridium perfringens]